MSNREEYQHKALRQPRSIRVIILKGTAGGLFKRSTGPHEPLEIELEEVSLDAFPKYEALSYTWDGQSPDRPIRCHRKTLNITRNCEIALFRLRTKTKRRLWVDSICIDQKSTPEKNCQVPLMGTIYGQAQRVLVWLGEGTKASDRTFRYLGEMHGLIMPFLRDVWMPQLAAGPVPNDLRIQMPQAVEQELVVLRLAFEDENRQMYGRAGTAESNMMQDVFRRSWFSRMWTIQELVLNFKALMMCGEFELPWDRFVAAVSWNSVIEKKTFKYAHTFWPNVEIYFELRRTVLRVLAVVYQSQERRLSKFLIRARNFECQNPRDKLYALFGFFDAIGIHGLPPVDYNRPVSQVYTEFTKNIMVHDQSLEILYELGGSCSYLDLPSWVPDWSKKRELSKISHENFKASSSSPLLFRLDMNDELHLPGVIIDTVKKRPELRIPLPLQGGHKPEDVLPHIVQRIRTWQQWFRLARELAPGLRDRAGTVPDYKLWVQFFLKTVLRGNVEDDALEASNAWLSILMAYDINGPEGGRCVELIDEIVQWTLERPAIWRLHFSGDTDPIPTINTREWRIMIALADPTEIKQISLHAQICKMTAGMTLFTTQNGSLGTASDLIQPDDQVVLISGMSLPIIIRPQDDGSHRMVAPAYIHGVMNGELWPGDDIGNLTNFIFK